MRVHERREVKRAAEDARQDERRSGKAKARERKVKVVRDVAGAARHEKERVRKRKPLPSGDPLHSGDKKRQRLLPLAQEVLERAGGKGGEHGKGGHSGKGSGGEHGKGGHGGKGGEHGKGGHGGKGGGGKGGRSKGRGGKGGGGKGGGGPGGKGRGRGGGDGSHFRA